MKKILILTAVLAAALFAACAGSPRTPEAPGYTKDTEAPSSVRGPVLLDSKTKPIGEDSPEWVRLYLAEGDWGVESLDRFKDKYVFVTVDQGGNLTGLQQWVSGFSVAQNISRLISTRVEDKLAGAGVGGVDGDFARYSENVLTAVSKSAYSGARKEADHWELWRYYKEDGKTTDREEYRVYVLTAIDKVVLQRQVNAALDNAEPDPAQTPELKRAVDLVRETFYEGF
jgi:hypothetical protein